MKQEQNLIQVFMGAFIFILMVCAFIIFELAIPYFMGKHFQMVGGVVGSVISLAILFGALAVWDADTENEAIREENRERERRRQARENFEMSRKLSQENRNESEMHKFRNMI